MDTFDNWETIHPRVHQPMNGLIKHGTSIQGDIIWPLKEMKY